MKKLPIGIQTFKEIIKDNYLYIDKTDLALELIENHKYIFLSRPRRFGKSLFVDTLKNIFEGNRYLFKGLHIYDNYHFSSYPVIYINWDGRNYQNLSTTKLKANEILELNRENLEIELNNISDPSIYFETLIQTAYKKYNKQVVILIDEYDKPVIDNLNNTNLALENVAFLKEFYEILKANDQYIKFAFLTGRTKLSKDGIFSSLNIITDISLIKKYSTICGFTKNNLENQFKEYLKGVEITKIAKWYCGYNFLGEKVFNPFDILQFIENEFSFKNYWWDSGNHEILKTLLDKHDYNLANLENIILEEEDINSFDVVNLPLEILLFQTGYLTIDKELQKINRLEYKLKIPNRELQTSLNLFFINYLTDEKVKYEIQDKLYSTLEEEKVPFFIDTFISLFTSLKQHKPSNSFYLNIFWTYLSGTGVKIITETIRNNYIDLTLFLHKQIYILRFKINHYLEPSTIKKLENEKYHLKYNNSNKNLFLISIDFDKKTNNIAYFEWKKIEKE